MNVPYTVFIQSIWKIWLFSLANGFNNLFSVPQDPAVAFAKKGYHILLEKPMAVSIWSWLYYYSIYIIAVPEPTQKYIEFVFNI